MFFFVRKFYLHLYLLPFLFPSIISSLLSAVEAHYRDTANPYPGENEEDNDILSELTTYLETTGISDPLSKVIGGGRLKNGVLFSFLFLRFMSQLGSWINFHILIFFSY